MVGTGTVVFGTSEGTLPTGWTTGGVSSDGVIVNTSSRTVRVILGAVATRSEGSDTHDFVQFDIDGVTNSTISSSVETSGSTATVKTKKADGTVLETFTSGSFFTMAAGSYTVRGRVLSGVTGINGITVFLMSPQTGQISTTTANSRYGSSDGEFLFQNLNSGMYMLGVDQYSKSGATNYNASFPTSINVSSSDCPSDICSRNLSVSDASSGATVTLSISGTFSNDVVDIFASGGSGGFRMVTSTLNGTLTNNTGNSIKLNSNGKWFVGFGPAMKGGMFNSGGPAAPPAWIVPQPKEVFVSNCETACVATPNTISFSATAADKAIKYKVQDAGATKIGQAFVFAYSTNGIGNGGSANADGTGSLSLAYGTYKIGASVPGMPPGVEHSVEIRSVSSVDTVFIDGSSTGIALSAMTASDLILVVSKPSYYISGKVTDGTNAVSNAPVSAFRTDGKGHANTFTNSSGEYTLYVDNGTWKVSAFLPQLYGKLPEKTITISGGNKTSQNFEPDTSSVNYATITKDIGSDTDGDSVFDGGEGLSNVQVTVEGTTSAGAHYINTVLTDSNGSSTLKVPPGTYTMKAWSPTIGNLPAFDSSLVVNSAGTATTNPSNLLAPQTASVTVNVLDQYGVATTTDKLMIEFQQIGGNLDNVGVLSSVSSSVFTLPVYDAGAAGVAQGAATSTSPANFYLMKITSPGISAEDISVYGNSNTIMATSTVVDGLYKLEVDGTETINVRLPAVNYMTGTVLDGDGNAVANAVVHIENSSTGETIEVDADSSGNYTAKLGSDTYLVQAQKDGYIDTSTSISVTASGTIAAAGTTMAVATRTITGTITADSSAVVGANVRAEQLGGDVVTATTGSDGTYTLRVINGDWKVSASASGYTEKAYSSVVSVAGANVSGVSIALSSTNSTLAETTSLSMTPQTGGTLNGVNAGVGIKAPSASLSNSASNFSLSESETSMWSVAAPARNFR